MLGAIMMTPLLQIHKIAILYSKKENLYCGGGGHFWLIKKIGFMAKIHIMFQKSILKHLNFIHNVLSPHSIWHHTMIHPHRCVVVF